MSLTELPAPNLREDKCGLHWHHTKMTEFPWLAGLVLLTNARFAMASTEEFGQSQTSKTRFRPIRIASSQAIRRLFQTSSQHPRYSMSGLRLKYILLMGVGFPVPRITWYSRLPATDRRSRSMRANMYWSQPTVRGWRAAMV